MRTRRWALAALVAALATVSVPPATLVAAGDLPAFMVGCWSGSRDGQVFTERWVRADAATLIGTSHTTKGGVLREFEFLRVVMKDGTPTYVAQPGGAPATEFAAASEGDAEIVFANPAHDFPKRIGYRRLDATRLTAWIDGGTGAPGSRLEFAMTRTPCEP